MIRRQRNDYGQNRIIHTNGSKENLLFIINRMTLTQKKKLMTALTSRKSFAKPNLNKTLAKRLLELKERLWHFC